MLKRFLTTHSQEENLMSEFSITPEEESPQTTIDNAKLEQYINGLRSQQSLPLALGAGLAAAVISAVLFRRFYGH